MKLKSRHVLELDGLKGLAIVMIVAYGCYWVPLSFGLILPAEPGGIDYWLQMLLGSGWIGTDLLMVIAGILSTNELLYGPGLRPFYLRRLKRLAPAYFLLLGVWFGLAYLYRPELTRRGDWLGLASLWTFTSNFLAAKDGLSRLPVPLQHLWAVAVAAQFYLVWPLLMKSTGGRRGTFIACAVMVMATPALRAAMIASDESLHTAVQVLTPLRLDSFAWGAMVSLTGDRLMSKAWLPTVGIVSFGILAIYFFWFNGLSTADPVVTTGGFTLLAIFFASLIPLIVPRRENEARTNPLTVVLNFPLLHTLGRYGYGIYLFHQPVLVLFLYLAYLPGPGWSPFIIFAALSTGISLLLAMFSFQFWERRFT